MCTKSCLGISVAGLLFASVVYSAEPAVHRPAFDTVTKVAAVTTRDGSGRAQRFTDTGNREFAVKYDAQQRVQAVEATRGPHISDIVSVGYAPDGKLIGVMFRSGYTLFFDNQADGAQVIRDSRGAVMRRDKGTNALQSVDGIQSASKLALTVAGFESLMKSLKHPMR